MTTLLAVDPGIRGCGVAAFRDGALAWAAYAKSPVESGDGPAEAAEAARAVWCAAQGERVAGGLEVVVEWPRVYQRGGGRTAGDPNDLRGLCAVGGALAAIFSRVTCVEPSEWKGQLDKAATARRVRGRLAPGEIEVLDAAVKAAGKTLGHNVADACGIGLWRLGRLERARALARE